MRAPGFRRLEVGPANGTGVGAAVVGVLHLDGRLVALLLLEGRVLPGPPFHLRVRVLTLDHGLGHLAGLGAFPAVSLHI